MKKLILIILAILSLNANSQPKTDQNNMKRGVNEFVKVYKEGGMAGAAGKVLSCYEQVSGMKPKSNAKYSKFEFCVAMDLAARKWDSDMVQRLNFPRHEFFELEEISDRLAGINEWELVDEDDRLDELLEFVGQYVYIAFQTYKIKK